MPKPTPSDVHVNAVLTNLSVAYTQSLEKFIADKVFPVVPVQKQSDRYFKYNKGDLLRDEAMERAPGTESAGIHVGIDNTPSYYCAVYAVHEDVDDQLRANADSPLNPDQDATENVTFKLYLKRERIWAANYFKTGVWDNEWTGTAAAPGVNEFKQWDQPDADPISDVQKAADTIEELTGYTPNVLVLSPPVFRALKNCPAILDRIKYTQKGTVTADLLAGLFEVDKVLVARGIYNKAAEGATEDISYIFGKHALLVYSNPRPGIKKPSAGYIFQWQGLVGAGANGVRIKKFRMEHLAADRIEGEMAFDMKIVGADLGLFFKDAVA